jgi:TolB-like protein
MLRTIIIVSLLFAASLVRAVEPAASQPAPLKVLVVPFTVVGGDAKQAWIGRAVQQNLQAELARQSDIEVIGTLSLQNQRAILPPVDGAALDDATAFAVGKAANADILVFGNCQVVGTSVRITGRILDIGTQEIIGFLKATGLQSQLLTMEDALVSQTMKFLGYSTTQPDDQAAGPAIGQGPVLEQPAEPAPTESYAGLLEPAYSYPPYDSSYTDYPYAYAPYYYPYTFYHRHRNIFFGWNGYCPRHHRRDCDHGRDHDRDRDHDRHPSDGRGRGPRIDDPDGKSPGNPRQEFVQFRKPTVTPRVQPKLPKVIDGRSLPDVTDRTRNRPTEIKPESPTKVITIRRREATAENAAPQPRTTTIKREPVVRSDRAKPVAKTDVSRTDRERTVAKVVERPQPSQSDTTRRESPVRTQPRNDPPPARTIERPTPARTVDTPTRSTPVRPVDRPSTPVRSADPTPVRPVDRPSTPVRSADPAPIRPVDRPSTPAPARDTSSSSTDRSSSARSGRR